MLDSYKNIMEKKDEKCLKSAISKIIENEGNHSEDLEHEISKKLIEYLNRNSCLRKKIPFITDKNLESNSHNLENSFFIVNKISEAEIKLGCRSMKYLADLLDSTIIHENEFIVENLVEYAKNNNLLYKMGENTMEGIINFINNNPDVVVIACISVKTLIDFDYAYEESWSIIGDENICYLDEAKGYIILLDNSENMFKIFEEDKLITLMDNSNEESFNIHVHDAISINKINKKFLSIIKINHDL